MRRPTRSSRWSGQRMSCSVARNHRQLTSYGAVTQVEQDGSTQSYSDLKFVPRRLATPKEDRTELRIASRPCLIPFDLASWAVIKPLAAALMAAAKAYRDESRKEKK